MKREKDGDQKEERERDELALTHLFVQCQSIALCLHLSSADEYTRVSIESSKGEANVVVNLDDFAEGPSILELCSCLLLHA